MPLQKEMVQQGASGTHQLLQGMETVEMVDKGEAREADQYLQMPFAGIVESKAICTASVPMCSGTNLIVEDLYWPTSKGMTRMAQPTITNSAGTRPH